MPLVTITGKKKYFPEDCEPEERTAPLTPGQEAVWDLSQAFGDLVVSHCAGLGLNPADTPAAGVQTDIVKFHAGAGNAVDVWLTMQFSELPPDDETQARAYLTVEQILWDWFTDRGLQPVVAIDLFWGPDRGCLFDLATSYRIEW